MEQTAALSVTHCPAIRAVCIGRQLCQQRFSYNPTRIEEIYSLKPGRPSIEAGSAAAASKLQRGFTRRDARCNHCATGKLTGLSATTGTTQSLDDLLRYTAVPGTSSLCDLPRPSSGSFGDHLKRSAIKCMREQSFKVHDD